MSRSYKNKRRWKAFSAKNSMHTIACDNLNGQILHSKRLRLDKKINYRVYTLSYEQRKARIFFLII